MRLFLIFLIILLQNCISYESIPWSSYTLFTAEKNILKKMYPSLWNQMKEVKLPNIGKK